MRRTNPVRVISKQGLGLSAGRGACGRIPDVTDTQVATKHEHVVLLEDFGDEAVVLAQVQVALFGGDDAGGV